MSTYYSARVTHLRSEIQLGAKKAITTIINLLISQRTIIILELSCSGHHVVAFIPHTLGLKGSTATARSHGSAWCWGGWEGANAQNVACGWRVTCECRENGLGRKKTPRHPAP